MRNYVKKLIGVVAAIAVCLCILNINGMNAYAADTSITGNNTKATAYNYGKWSSINSNYATVILEAGQTESWLQFTLSSDEHIYLRASYDDEYEGEWFEIQDSIGNTVGDPRYTPDNVYNADDITPDIYLDCDNDTSSTKTYYLVLHRGSVDIDDSIYFSVSAYERIKTSSTTVSISGTASNAGNSSISLSGVDSSVITVNLTNNTTLPDNAIVTKISSSGTQSPSQGNVHHMIMPASNGIWYTSTVSSASRGSYDVDDNIPVKQLWSFKYNAMATAKSTMKNVKLTISFQYDLHDTDYVTYID
jgi:hypothetical protein